MRNEPLNNISWKTASLFIATGNASNRICEISRGKVKYGTDYFLSVFCEISKSDACPEIELGVVRAAEFAVQMGTNATAIN
jgi:hypothetical protein